MKTNIKGLIAATCALTLIAACNTEKVSLYDTAYDSVCFPTVGSTADTSRFAFGMLPDPNVESFVFTVAVNLVGSLTERDREFSVETLKGPGNSQTKYEIITPSLIKAGEDTAEIEVRVWKTPNLDTRDTVTIVLRDSKDLLAAIKTQSTRCLIFYSKVERPSWWEDYYFGRFHEIKMDVMQAVLGSKDNLLANPSEWNFLNSILNEYCQINDVRYPDTDGEVRFANGF